MPKARCGTAQGQGAVRESRGTARHKGGRFREDGGRTGNTETMVVEDGVVGVGRANAGADVVAQGSSQVERHGVQSRCPA